MAETIEVLLVDESFETRQAVKRMIASNRGVEVISEARNGQEALQRLRVISPGIIIMGVPEEITESVKDVEQITLQHPQIGVIVISEHRDWHYVRQYMRAGARDYLYIPIAPDILLSSIEDVYRMDRELHRRSAEAILSDEYSHEMEIVSLVSSKGGVGKSTIAVNLAVGLAKRGKATVLIDLDLQSGIDHLLLNLSPTRTIADLSSEMSDIEPDLLERYMLTHESGLKVLCAPSRPEEMELVQAADLRVIFQSLQRKYDYLVVDTSPAVNDVLLTALELSDQVLLVSTLNLAVLKSNRSLVKLLSDLGYDTAKIKCLVNRSNVKTGVTLQDVKQTFGTDVFWELDDDYRFVEISANEGVPFVSASKLSKLSRQVLTLVQKVAGDEKKPVTKLPTLRRKASKKGMKGGGGKCLYSTD